MQGIITMVLLGGIIFFFILYNVIISAVEEGTLKALKEYDKIKDKENIRE